MDQELQRRLDDVASPFDGYTLAPKTMIPINGLARCLGALLDAAEPGDEPWYALYDHHEADGVSTSVQRQGLDWVRQLADPAVLFARRSEQVLVSIGVYPETGRLYLRANVMNEDEDPDYPGRWGDFDLTGSAELVERAAGLVRGLGIDVEITPALQYFTERAAQ